VGVNNIKGKSFATQGQPSHMHKDQPARGSGTPSRLRVLNYIIGPSRRHNPTLPYRGTGHAMHGSSQGGPNRLSVCVEIVRQHAKPQIDGGR